MKHTEQPLPSPDNKPLAKAEPTKHPLLKLVIAGIAFALIGGYSMTQFFQGGKIDHLSDKEKAELITAFSKLENIKLTPVAADEVDAALDTMRLAPVERQQLKAAVTKPDPGNVVPVNNSAPQSTQKNSETRLAWVTLWDSVAQDNDSVSVSSAGYTAEILLANAPQRIAIPVDDSNQIIITGVVDGGGGITLGVQQGTGNVMLPVLAPGQTLPLPVTF